MDRNPRKARLNDDEGGRAPHDIGSIAQLTVEPSDAPPSAPIGFVHHPETITGPLGSTPAPCPCNSMQCEYLEVREDMTFWNDGAMKYLFWVQVNDGDQLKALKEARDRINLAIAHMDPTG